jgi:hypothetical protein
VSKPGFAKKFGVPSPTAATGTIDSKAGLIGLKRLLASKGVVGPVNNEFGPDPIHGAKFG